MNQNIGYSKIYIEYIQYIQYIKSTVSLKWQVGFENDIKMTPIFTIIFVSKILI